MSIPNVKLSCRGAHAALFDAMSDCASTSHSARPRSDWRHHLDAIHSSSPPPPPPPLIACFIASHVSTASRLASLRRLLASIDAQLPSPPRVHLSWSCGDESLREHIRQSLQYSWLSPIEQPTPHSQFEHLQKLANACAESSPPAWIFFSDDDDLWSPHRTQIFAAECQSAPPSLRAVLCRRKARPAPVGARPMLPSGVAPPRIDPNATLDAPEDATDVDALLATGRAVLCDTEKAKLVSLAGEGGAGSFDRAEYFDFALRFAALRAFVSLAPPALLKHKLCDLGFTSWLRDVCPPRSFLPSGSAATEWVYWYGQALGAQSASQEVDVLPEERKLAKQLRPASSGLFETDEACAAFLAVLRQRVEQELVQLRSRMNPPAINGLVPMQLLDSACIRQADAVVHGAAAPSWPPAALPRLQSWARKQCRGPICERLLGLLDFEAVVDLQSLAVTAVRRSARSREEILGGLSAAGALPHQALLRPGELM